MDIFLRHLDLGPLLYGLIMFVGLFVVWWKITRGMWLSVAIDIAVFVVVFKLHGGTMQGGFAAMIAALLAGLIFPMMLRNK